MEENPLRVVLLGKTGSGKSSFGNTLMGRNEFEVFHMATSGTRTCKAATKASGEITVIDTPGLFDNRMDEKELKSCILSSLIECSAGLHAFLIFLKVDRYTAQELQVIAKIEGYFSEEAFKYAVLVFTHGDQLPDGASIEDFIKDNEALKELLDKCGGRCRVVDNKYWNDNRSSYRSNQFQVGELLTTIRQLVRRNGGTCYTNAVLQKLETDLREETDRTGSRDVAKANVFKAVWEKISDLPIEMWLAALFGASAVIGIMVMKLLK